MLTGWVHSSLEGSEKLWWYFNEDGSLFSDDWLKYNNNWYLLASDGHMATGWVEDKDRDKWYYLDETGRMITGWLKLDNDWFYLRSDGSRVEDCLYEVGADNICAFDKEGKLLTCDITFYTNDYGYIAVINLHSYPLDS